GPPPPADRAESSPATAERPLQASSSRRNRASRTSRTAAPPVRGGGRLPLPRTRVPTRFDDRRRLEARLPHAGRAPARIGDSSYRDRADVAVRLVAGRLR